MHQKAVIASIATFVLIVAGMFVFALLKKQELQQQQEQVQVPKNDKIDVSNNAYDSVQRISAKHYYIDGTHTLVGEVSMPTPCDLLQAEADVVESFPEQVTVDFTVINNSDTCAQVITPQRFMVSVEASENAMFRARFQGRDVTLNLIPAAEGETPQDFELFIKG